MAIIVRNTNYSGEVLEQLLTLLITKVDILDGKPSADKFYVERATPDG